MFHINALSSCRKIIRRNVSTMIVIIEVSRVGRWIDVRLLTITKIGAMTCWIGISLWILGFTALTSPITHYLVPESLVLLTAFSAFSSGHTSLACLTHQHTRRLPSH